MKLLGQDGKNYPSDCANTKGLDKQNLRDQMTRLELIITSLSEEVTRSIAVNTDAQGFNATTRLKIFSTAIVFGII